MSGKLKEVRMRIASVKSTQQITKAMKMVSAAKLRRAQDAIVTMRPYANKLNDMLSKIAATLGGDMQLSLAEERPVEKVLVVLITSDRGLAGSYNSTLIKLAQQAIQETYAAQAKAGQVTLMTIGKKGYDFFKKRFNNVDTRHWELFHHLSFEHVSAVAAGIIADFEQGKYDRVDVIYSHFKNAASQAYTVEQYLPIVKQENVASSVSVDYLFEPGKERIIEELMPKILRTQFFKFMLEANASEHGARMTAMDKATENANELLRDLRLKYNQARQAAITTELNEIVSGAAALEG